MKIKSVKLRLSYFFRQPGKDSLDNMLELVKPESEWKRTESVIEYILRWAADGGQKLDIRNPVYPSNSEMTGKQANE